MFFPLNGIQHESLATPCNVCNDALFFGTGEKCRVIAAILEEWKQLNLNAVICPLFPFPAPPVNLPGLLPSKLSTVHNGENA